jgi:hypothetical protein
MPEVHAILAVLDFVLGARGIFVRKILKILNMCDSKYVQALSRGCQLGDMFGKWFDSSDTKFVML